MRKAEWQHWGGRGGGARGYREGTRGRWRGDASVTPHLERPFEVREEVGVLVGVRQRLCGLGVLALEVLLPHLGHLAHAGGEVRAAEEGRLGEPAIRSWWLGVRHTERKADGGGSRMDQKRQGSSPPTCWRRPAGRRTRPAAPAGRARGRLHCAYHHPRTAWGGPGWGKDRLSIVREVCSICHLESYCEDRRGLPASPAWRGPGGCPGRRTAA